MTRSALAISAALLALGAAGNAAAQDAAETATILSGTSQQAKAQRSLGSAISRSINNASNAIRSSRNAGPVAIRGPSRNRGSGGAYRITAHGDPLAGTDAPTYRLGNGASIRVSGVLRPEEETVCISNCPA